MSLTGVLLVGGASARFGSPKALAEFRGRTLVAWGYGLLAEACDEVLVVGKAGELGDLSFPVVDDGTDERAPVFGLIAGLRRAANEHVVALPVDVPLVTSAVLRALGEAAAVPSAGIPLPGGYPRSLLPDLQRRVASGELSLRGVNANLLEVPAEMLVDADTPDELAALASAGSHRVLRGGRTPG